MLWRYTLRCPTYLGPGEQLPLGLAYHGRHVGDLDRSQIMGSIGDPAIPKTGGVWATPKRYVGRIWLDTNPMAHSGRSRACASFAPPMSVRIFGHSEQFSTFSARRAPCSAPSCTPDAWTNGPYMTWVLWILVTMVRTPRGRSGATFVKVLAQTECGRFCHFGNSGPNLDCHHAGWHEDLWQPRAWESLLDSRWIVYGMADPISKTAWRYTIEGTPDFGSF